jgi:IS605 OrfB family transposase
MKLIAQVKIIPSPEQHAALLETMKLANAACNIISEAAWEQKTFGKLALHHLTYHAVKKEFGLTAQVVVRCIAKVADAYKLDRKTKRIFRPLGSIAFDDRILRWYSDHVSIWTVAGRQKIPFVCGERQDAMLLNRQGESDLVFRKGQFYLLAVCNVEEPDPIDVDSFLGIDLGVANIATTSDGEMLSGKTIKKVRYRHRRLRQKLQKKGTKASRRRLKKLSGQERRFATDINHCLSKRIVAIAKGTGRGIALEDLTHIRTRITAHRSQRATLHSWAFSQLRAFIEYKAQLTGVPVITVDPRNTSCECPNCGCIAKQNRSSQSQFRCTSCGLLGHADVIAAGNIARRAQVNAPYVSDARLSPPTLAGCLAAPGTSYQLSAGSS